MEQKKTLWIALSTGIFLLAVFLAAMMLYYPSMNSSGSALALNGSDRLYVGSSMNKKANSAITNLPDSKNPVSGTSSSLNETSPVTSGLVAPQEGTSSLDNGYTASASVSGSYAPAEDPVPGNTTININSPVTTINLKDLKESDSSAAIASVTAKNEAAAQELKETKIQKKVEEKSTVSKTETAKTSATPAKTPATKTETAKAAPAKTTSAASPSAHYWVQVASYSSKTNADEARDMLDKKAMPCEVFTFTKDNKLYYRVRVGPYTTKSEADYWKKQVDAISMFKSSGSLVVDSSAKAK